MFKTAIKLDEDAISFLALAAARDYLNNNTPPSQAIANVIVEQGYDVTPEQISRIVEKTNNYIYLTLLKEKKSPPKFPVAKRDDVLKAIDARIHKPEETSQEKISSLLEKTVDKYANLFDTYLEQLLMKTGDSKIEEDNVTRRPITYFELIEGLRDFKNIVEDEIEKVESQRFEILTKMVKEAANDIINNDMKLTDFINYLYKVADEVLAHEIVIMLDKELHNRGFDKYADQPNYLIRKSPTQYTYTIKTIMDQDAYRDALYKLPTITNDWIMYLEKTMSDLISTGKGIEPVPEAILIKIFNDLATPVVNSGLHKKSQQAQSWFSSWFKKTQGNIFKRLKHAPKTIKGGFLFSIPLSFLEKGFVI
mgnify:CR=1 FL=1